MSLEASKATWSFVLPELARRLKEIDVQRRPSYPKVALVALALADHYRSTRGWSNESVRQLQSQTGLSESCVRSSLVALDQLGFWRRATAGNRHSPSRRVPQFLEAPTVTDDGGHGPERESNPALYKNLERGLEEATARGVRDRAMGQARDTPVTTLLVSSSEDDDLVRAHLDAHVRHNHERITSPAALRASQLPLMLDVVERARRESRSPELALEDRWPTGHSIAAHPTGVVDSENDVRDRWEVVEHEDPHRGPTVTPRATGGNCGQGQPEPER